MPSSISNSPKDNTPSSTLTPNKKQKARPKPNQSKPKTGSVITFNTNNKILSVKTHDVSNSRKGPRKSNI